ncbi:MAG: hypothetical protein JWM11_6763 [Planctomycetaceae bacterium]|nr:hypothetical protein [Planctomycetaceae bacterium]
MSALYRTRLTMRRLIAGISVEKESFVAANSINLSQVSENFVQQIDRPNK